MGLIKNKRKATRLDKASAGEAMLKNVLNRAVLRLKNMEGALVVLATGENWAEAPGADQCIWLGEGNPIEIAQKGLEPPKPKDADGQPTAKLGESIADYQKRVKEESSEKEKAK